ncbi:carboxyl-terminal protease [Aurantibacter crassamenti]|nr:carboxyl-terminal protease [Aurantibacter crassamenti]
MNKYVLLFILSGIMLGGCKNDDAIMINPNIPSPDPSANVVVQDFMYRAMNTWYFWQKDKADLADDRFSNTEDYTTFLASETDPSAFFEKLKVSEDRFSRSSDDYKTWTNALAGISKSNGLEFGLVRLNQSDSIFGIVRYIIPNSNASTKSIKRGDIFMGVNGQVLTDDNYINLLFGDSDTYTLNMADIEDNKLTANDIEVSLTKEEGLAENPIFLDKIFEIGGKKIGYLVYNAFTDEYDEELNQVFGRFVAGQVDELVLDLRYNSGGDVNSARLLSSMIHGLHTDKVFLTQRWNAKWQAFFGEELTDNFADKTKAGTQLNTLNLSKVYIIATYGSASASELVINSLRPHMEVIHIGEKTRGKNEFSLTFVDDPQSPSYPYLFSRGREDKINPSNKWAIQPLCGRNENADGFSDYTSGLIPDELLQEDLANYDVLGDQFEPLLAKAIEDITGTTGKRSFEVKMPANLITDSKMFAPLEDRMFVSNPFE